LTYPVGALTYHVGALTYPVGALTYPVGALSYPVGALIYPVGALAYPVIESQIVINMTTKQAHHTIRRIWREENNIMSLSVFCLLTISYIWRVDSKNG
jgi:hypothetical protein